MCRFLSIAILTSLWTTSCLGQWGKHGVELSGARGFLLPHRSNMLHLPENPAHSLSFRYFRTGDQSRAWHHLYPGFEFGLHLQLMDLGNRNVLGAGLGAAAYFSAPIINQPKFTWHLEIGAGPGVVTKPFDANSNYKNIAIGSYLNSFIFAASKIKYPIHPQWHLTASASFNHFSNASVALPNLGVNYPLFSLGIQHQWSSAGNKRETAPDTIGKQASNWSFSVIAGIKQYPRPFASKYPVWVLSGERSFGISKKSSFTAGADAMYNLALLRYRTALGQAVEPINNTQIGFRGGYTMHIDRMELFLQLGLYLWDSYTMDGTIYNRVGLRYFFSKHVAVNLSLKTHLFKADYAEFGMAYRF